MRGTACAEAAIEIFERPDSLPTDAQALLDGTSDLFAGRAWWDLVLAHALPPGTRAAFAVGRVNDRTVMVAPMLRSAGRPVLQGLTTPYTCLYHPLMAPNADPGARAAAWRAFARFCRPSGVTRLDALPADWPDLRGLEQAARDSGQRILRFDHFGNWHEDVTDLGWTGYLARRPGALRETIRRRLRKADVLPGAGFAMLTAPAEMDRATAAYESVYTRSWKEPEPFPTFNTAFMRSMAQQGALRFGLWSIDEIAVAVQIWVVCNNTATVLKLAHDEAYKAHSPGTVLTAQMLRHLLDRERVTQIDFGRGDDDYKQAWAAKRRQRIGMLLVNPLRPAGAVELVRHLGGLMRARLLGRASV